MPSLRLCRALTALSCVLLASVLRAGSDYTTPYVFTTLAGFSSIGSNDGPGTLAHFYAPRGIATDSAGNIYVADAVNNTIRKITPAGVVSTLAGTPGIFGAGYFGANRPASFDGTGPAAVFSNPEGIAVDRANGLIYVTDKMDFTVRRITPEGVVSTLAGLLGQVGSADGTGSAARFHVQSGAAVDAAGNIYTTDWGNHIIRKITPAGVVTTLTGVVGESGNSEGAFFGSRFFQPNGIAADSAGNLYVADTVNNTIRKLTVEGRVVTIAGSPGTSGSADGTGSTSGNFGTARFFRPQGVTVDSAGNVYIADTQNSTVRKLTPAGAVTTLAGQAGQKGSVDGQGSAARFRTPWAITIDSANVLYVADEQDNTIRKITPDGTVTTLAGLGLDKSIGSADGSTAAAKFNNLAGTAVAANGDVYVADTLNATIRKIAANGTITTLAGKASATGSTDGTGEAARFVTPYGLAVDASGNVFVSDPGNETIRQITPQGVVTTLAGDPTVPSGSSDGTGRAARFNYPAGLTLDSAGNLYVADHDNATIRKISPDGIVVTRAGQAGAPGSADGSNTFARFNQPTALTMSRSGDLYVADTGNHTIRKITPDGSVSTIAGQAGFSGSDDGVGASARFSSPDAISIDPAGNLYIADTGNHLVRKITPNGTVSTIAGLARAGGYADGSGKEARFDRPVGVAVSTQGILYVTSGATVRKGQLAGPPVIIAQPQGQTVTAGASVQLSATASASPDPTYQWNFNGQPLAGATASTLTLAAARTADTGTYTIVVTNSLGSVTSDNATVTVNAVTAPPPTTPTPTTPSAGGSGGGGGGAPSLWFLSALLLLGLLRRLHLHRAIA